MKIKHLLRAILVLFCLVQGGWSGCIPIPQEKKDAGVSDSAGISSNAEVNGSEWRCSDGTTPTKCRNMLGYCCPTPDSSARTKF